MYPNKQAQPGGYSPYAPQQPGAPTQGYNAPYPPDPLQMQGGYQPVQPGFQPGYQPGVYPPPGGQPQPVSRSTSIVDLEQGRISI